MSQIIITLLSSSSPSLLIVSFSLKKRLRGKCRFFVIVVHFLSDNLGKHVLHIMIKMHNPKKISTSNFSRTNTNLVNKVSCLFIHILTRKEISSLFTFLKNVNKKQQHLIPICLG